MLENVHNTALDGVAQWIEYWLVNQRVTSSIPRQGTCLGCEPGPQMGACKKQPHIDVSLSLSFSLPSPCSKNKFLKIFYKKERKCS